MVLLMSIFSLVAATIVVVVVAMPPSSSGAVWPPCCLQVNGSCRTACEQISSSSTADAAASQEARQKNLEVLNMYCAKTLVSFWKCLNETFQDLGEGFTGRACCHLPQTEGCRLSCLKARNKKDLLENGCRPNDESTFYSCLEWQEAGIRCCLNAKTQECQQACKDLYKFGANSAARDHSTFLNEACSGNSAGVFECIRNHTGPTRPPARPQRNIHCCERSKNEQCMATCRKALRSNSSSQEVVMDSLIEGGCGHPAIHDSLWQCFLSNSDVTRSNSVSTSAPKKVKLGRDAAKLSCCFKATTPGCQKHCFKTYSKEWESSWKSFYRLCLYQPAEAKMISCLEEVDEPCELGCDGLTYCSEFNDRPKSMFRSCNAWSDQTAHNELQVWRTSGGYINTSLVSIPIMDVAKCYPSMWKGIACLLAIKPCTARQGFDSSGLCWSDCVAVLTKCIDYKRLSAEVSPESICNLLLPNGHDAACTPLVTYLAQRSTFKKQKEVTFPCNSSPCNVTDVCMVDRDCTGTTPCPRHLCVSGCRMGEASHMVLPVGSLVHIPISSTNAGCHKVCRCSSRSTFEDCFTPACKPLDDCWIGGKRIAHKTTFQLDCNSCVCYGSEVLCSNRVCSNVGDREVSGLTGLPCNCPNHYVPVCGANGRTYPSACVASCAGLTDLLMEFGACGVIDPCHPNPCKRGLRCLPLRDVCLTIARKPCPKYKCVDVIAECASGVESAVCDTSHVTHPSLCSLLQNDRTLAYHGRCLEKCAHGRQVCGQDGETYRTACAAWANRIHVDYDGPCRSHGTMIDGVADKCKDVDCPPLPQGVRCNTVIPPGSCCPICGAALKLFHSKQQTDQIQAYLDDRGGRLTVRDVVLALRRYLSVAECDAFGHLAVDGDLVLVIATTVATPLAVQLEVCVREAEKIVAMIQQQSPKFLSNFMLSSIVMAEAVHYDTSIAGITLPLWTLMISSVLQLAAWTNWMAGS